MRRTGKYVAAEAIAERFEWDLVLCDSTNQNDLYNLLQKHGWMWDSKTGKWIYLPEIPATKPTQDVMVRVWTDLKKVDGAADKVVENMPMTLVERSEARVCRPPKQLEGRVYLRFRK